MYVIIFLNGKEIPTQVQSRLESIEFINWNFTHNINMSSEKVKRVEADASDLLASLSIDKSGEKLEEIKRDQHLILLIYWVVFH